MKRFTSNPFADSAFVFGYEAWYETTGRRADRLEKALLKQLLVRFPRVSTILEVGCRTGHFTCWFGEQGVRVVGLDLSRPMLAEAVCLVRPPYVCSGALALPFSTVERGSLPWCHRPWVAVKRPSYSSNDS
jgi:SAM-dependent methyltransferase